MTTTEEGENPGPSRGFRHLLALMLDEYRAAQDDLDRRFDSMLDELVDSETDRIKRSGCAPAVGVGDRVRCSNYKRAGTVIAVNLHIDILTDEYYSDRKGPGRYVSVDDVKDWHRESDVLSIAWSYTVQPDPSPKRGIVPPPVKMWHVEPVGAVV